MSRELETRRNILNLQLEILKLKERIEKLEKQTEGQKQSIAEMYKLMGG